MAEFSQAFAIDEKLGSIYGLKVVTRDLTYALIRLNRQQEALNYYDRAITATNNHPDLIRLRDRLMK
ncbi:hypothetical protein [Alkalinema sp. FACHB-956]|uniref:hypothetical protein n=1 Tax=Alkalinema sp. FACHB-956 TaxID=2692768 RepID=UPI0016847AFA|nr:hypothetical protein [Alkalinema sp. FACHB-956]MBD2328556.1 hypothetical protein [Alkalinema sp. FACHB-956]